MAPRSAFALVEQYYHDCGMDRFPKDHDVRKAFLFDRCTDWTMLFGTAIGIVKFVEAFTEKDYREALARAIEQRRVVQCIDDIYTEFYADPECEHGHSGYYRWFQQNKERLARLENSGPVQAGVKVLLSGLSKAPHLNEALGTVVGDAEGAPPNLRFPVRLLGPSTALAKHPAGVRVRAANLERAPDNAALAVLVDGMSINPAWCTAFKKGAPAAEREIEWNLCRVPTQLGLPLVLYQLSGHGQDIQSQEKVAVLLLIDQHTGLAPPDVQMRGLGPILVARFDGGDLTVQDVADLHDYNCHLMDLWPDWLERGPAGEAERKAALTPAAFQRYTQQRREESAFAEDDDE